MNLYLVGYMYAGKTTIGRHLARRLGFDFVDTDALFEQRYHSTVPIFFEHYGEDAFRKLERQILETTALMDNTVVATGGGTPVQGDNMQWILDHGTAVYLQMSYDAICARMARSRKKRPLLQGMTPDERRAYVCRQLALRQPVYQRAHLVVDAFNPNIDAIVTTITQSLGG